MWRVGSVHAGDLRREGAVYVGRGGKGLEASPLANPFRLDERRPRAEQGDVLERYRQWLWGELKRDTPARREVARLAAMEDGVLVCFCRPLDGDAAARPCHADTIARAVEWWRVRIVGVRWAEPVNVLSLGHARCAPWDHPADEWWARCPTCRHREHLQAVRERYAEAAGVERK